MITCSRCGGNTQFKEGIKKETGKPWNGYFCQDQSCKNVDWKPKTGTSPQPQNSPKDGFAIIGEALYRIEEKLDILLGEKGLKTEFKETEIPVINERSGEFEKVGDILKAEDDIEPKDILF